MYAAALPESNKPVHPPVTRLHVSSGASRAGVKVGLSASGANKVQAGVYRFMATAQADFPGKLMNTGHVEANTTLVSAALAGVKADTAHVNLYFAPVETNLAGASFYTAGVDLYFAPVGINIGDVDVNIAHVSVDIALVGTNIGNVNTDMGGNRDNWDYTSMNPGNHWPGLHPYGGWCKKIQLSTGIKNP